MEQAYKLRGDVLAEHGVARSETYDTDRTEVTSDKPLD
jgi:hypothetical protein